MIHALIHQFRVSVWRIVERETNEEAESEAGGNKRGET